jgi:hypothetical protein
MHEGHPERSAAQPSDPVESPPANVVGFLERALKNRN